MKVFPAKSSLMWTLLPQSDKPGIAFGYDIQHPDKTGGSID